MIKTILLTFLAGLLGGNSFPHFVKGITKEIYPNVFGGTPVSNLIVGWVGFLIAVILVFFSDIKSFPLISLASGGIGILLIGLFHAGPGAFGRKPNKD